MIRSLRALVRLIFMVSVLMAVVVAVGGGLVVWHYSHGLPSETQLLSYVPPSGTKVYAADGTLMAEFENQHRIPTPFAKIPPLVVHAFLAAEDRDFYSHGGVNPASILRAAVADIVRYDRGQRPLGASTITQQLVRHFLLTNQVSLSRKIKEALLAYKIEHYLSKNRILEIYLNEIYLGAGSYGVAAAADTYFHKTLDELTPAEAATLAALPKAPHIYNPLRNPAAAKARRDWVLGGMREMGWLSPQATQAAIAEPIRLAKPNPPGDDENGYFVEDVRRELIARYGEKVVYEGGLTVRTSYVAADQTMADKAFRHGLVTYDRRHGWRGPVAHYPTVDAALAALPTTAAPFGIGSWQVAAVVSTDWNGARIALKGGGAGRIPLEELRWARRTLDNQGLGAPVYRASQVLSPGDVILVEALGDTGSSAVGRHRGAAMPLYGLRQIPKVSGAMVVMKPSTGRILAIVGGWDFRQSQFDRATQAWRQPGSSIKPFVYITALEGNFTPSSIVDDAPISLPQGPGLPMWSPVNYEDTFVGPSTLRQALVHSRNLVTARLASMIGMKSIAETVQEFGIMDKMPLYYSMALGAGDTTVVRMTGAYAMLDNGGHWVLPSLIDTVQDRDGRILYQKGAAYCASCFIIAGPRSGPEAAAVGGFKASPLPPHTPSYLPHATYAANAMLYRPTKPDPMVGPIADYQIISMMEDVVQHGTGTAVAAVGKPLAGKTGTTNNWNDAWFVGFSPDLVAGVYVGFDHPHTLGHGETGGHVAAPIFRDFMEAALANTPATPFKEPANAEMVRVDDTTGQPAGADDPNSILEAFRPGTGPESYTPSQAESDSDEGPIDADVRQAYGSSVPPGEGSGLPPGTIVPAPTSGPGDGTGGLY